MTTLPDLTLAERIARLEDLEAIRSLDARYCRHLDDGDWDALMDLFTDDGEFDGLSRPAARPRCASSSPASPPAD